MRLLYTFIFRLALPVIMIRLLWRSYKAPAYRRRWRERFAWFEAPEQTGGLWLHAVSLGESTTAIPLIKAFKQQYPAAPVTVTTMTPTGSEKIRATFGDDILNIYVPYDLPGIIKRFLRKVQPRLVVIMETELWPNMLYCLKQQKIPVMLANGRLSERSTQNYARIKVLTKKMVNCFTQLAVQTQLEAQRYAMLGAAPDKITVTGSIKFDIQLPGDLEDKAQGLRRNLGIDRIIWVAASTHEGEEDQVLDAFHHVRGFMPQLLLLLVPRHPERFSKVASLCKKRGFNIILRSENRKCRSDTDIFIGDTVGEMLLFYAASDLAFVGGSLVAVGGHNVLEPAALGKAFVTGPFMDNFANIIELLLADHATKQIQNKEELAQAILELLQNKRLRESMGENGRKVVEQNRGALTKHLELMKMLFEKSQ